MDRHKTTALIVVTDPITEQRFTCPYCWEQNETMVERQELPMELIEDCRVCCHPIQLRISIDASGRVQADAEPAA
ncbi:MAG: CPXCG motif-containing cysteine-rich protein [Gammaproteobacteria bacterium]|nr:MAG: CPXCG motif-containing cysteine-rich protein [Gammaproteobacteria bacterium]